jgi:TonB-linked SusC/RagA family outer membrane protein
MIRKRLHDSLLLLCLMAPCFLLAQEDTSGVIKIANKPSSIPSTYNLLYQVQQKKRTTAAVAEIYTPDLTKTVSTTFGGWLSGRLPGIYVSQGIGEPGFDDATVIMRGQAPLVLIDGTPQSFPSINPEQIESITLLKDAVATAMLGVRGSNGAILITTKKGERNSGQHIEFTARYGVARPTVLPKFMNAFNYASLYNEALANDGRTPAYAQADLDAYRSGSDPIGHPDVDWQRTVLKDQTPISRYDLSISGGNRTTRYFVNLDYLHQDGLLRTADSNVYNTNSDYKRYMIRSNVEIDLSKYITTSLNLTGRIQNSNQPGANTGTIFSNFINTPNNAYPVFNSNGSLGGTLDYQSNILGQAVRTGYRPVYERDFKADLSIRGNLDALVKGLWVKGLAALNAYQRETFNRNKNFEVFRESTTGGVKNFTKYTAASDQSNTLTINSQNRLFYTELSAGYSKDFGNSDHLEAVALYNNDYRMENGDLPYSYTGGAAKVSWDHQGKYFADLAMGYNGTERLPIGQRNGFFPALGLGWNLTNETFLKDKVKWLNNLKLHASFGKTGNVNVGYYEYNQYYVQGADYGFGASVGGTFTLRQADLANPVITFEKADKLSAGVEASFLDNRLSLTVDYFNDKYYDLVQARLDGSAILGAGYARENIGSNRYHGLEIQANWQETTGGLTYFVSPNFTLVQSKVLNISEPQRLYSYMMQTGRPVGAAYGYVAEGLFNSQAEITGHAFQGSSIVPGDIKYKDLNGDKVIDANDQQVIGNTKPQVYYGLNTGLGYKGFDLAVLFQGVANLQRSLAGYAAFQNSGKGQAYDYQLNRWTPTNTVSPSYPRVWLGTNTNNNLNSSYWLHKADYLRVKSIELGYSLPAFLTGKVKLQLARVFVNATNLFTFSSLHDKNIDPEVGVGGYPIMKTINAGVTVKL